MTQDELVQELERVLPKAHPIFDKLDQPLKRATDVKDLVDTVDSVFGIVEDWSRGIRDWQEVEDVLDQARAELTLYKENTR
jgi:hypothetical protein